MTREIVLCVHDNVNSNDISLDAQCYKRGDVIITKPSGFAWTEFELTYYKWRIIRVNNLTEEIANTFVARELPSITDNPLLQRRAFMFDFDSPLLTPSFIDFLNDDTRQIPIYETNLPLSNISNLKKIRPTRIGEFIL